MIALTDRQAELVSYVRQRIAANSQPTVREIAKHMGITSPNGVTRHLELLENKGVMWRNSDGDLVVNR